MPRPTVGARLGFDAPATIPAAGGAPDEENKLAIAGGKFRVFLMQNHPLMVLGTTGFLSRLPDFAVSGSATTPKVALATLPNAGADVVIFELSITGPFDFPFLTELRRRHPRLPILAYAYHEEVIFARRAIDAGANGYLMKEAQPNRLAEALRYVLDGGVYISDRVRKRIHREEHAAQDGRERELNGALVNSLTIRELQIFQCLGDEYSGARIQQELGISARALANACHRMRKKLGLNSLADLVQFASHWAYYEGDFS